MIMKANVNTLKVAYSKGLRGTIAIGIIISSKAWIQPNLVSIVMARVDSSKCRVNRQITAK